MAALNRPKVANYITKENYTVGKTKNFDDHTFSGIMFNIKCRSLLPVHVSSLIVRNAVTIFCLVIAWLVVIQHILVKTKFAYAESH